MNIRCRGPNGLTTLTGLDQSTTVLQFQAAIAEKSGVPVERQELLLGTMPPKVLKIPEDPARAVITSLGLQNGDSITVRMVEGSSTAAMHPQTTSSDASQAPASQSSAPHSVAPAPQPAAAPSGGQESAPQEVVLPSGSVIVRRIIDSDNSCLFNAVGYVMERSRGKSAALREVIATAVRGDPFTYNEGVLGKDTEAYCDWIRKPGSWGGAIELSILASHYKREIAAFDLQTMRCDVYGEDAGYAERVMLLYDGLHYDALAVGAFERAPEEVDVTILSRDSPQQLAEATDGARVLVERCHKAKQFTDTGNFTLRCNVCQIGVKGEAEATEHAKATGHTNFVEYS
mmetsp:Transcript_7569/g.19456  ORF Transcript_7569/g.19456 Transcript_7569/m.19456 type:complete len:344 (+) Transcript_7569:209-1240(+)|eukprot:jgi/Tetstr1/460315/TSEL_005615.t1